MRVNAPQTRTQQSRLNLTLEVALGLGLALVYFGHMLEKFTPLFSVAGFAQTAVFLTWKVLYSFHMALFFIIAGMQIGQGTSGPTASRDHDFLGLQTKRILSHLLFRRLLPFAAFSAIGVTLHGLLGLWPEQNGQKGLEFYPGHYLDMFSGIVHPWTVQWLLISIGVIEAIMFLPRRLGWLAYRKEVLISAVTLLTFSLWRLAQPRATAPFYFHPASMGVTISLTLLGVYGSPWLSALDRFRRLPVAVAAAVICFLSALANVGDVTVSLPSFEQVLGNRFAVLFVLGSYGNPFWFVLSVLSGTVVVLILAWEASSRRLGLGLAAAGQEYLILFLVNGLFLAFVNGGIAANLAPTAGVNSAPALVFVSLAIAIGELSLAWIVVVWWRRLQAFILSQARRRHANHYS